MAYTIRIGECYIYESEEGDLWVDVEEVKHSDAPTFPGDDMTGNSNDRGLSYLAWSQFCEKAGLNDLFFHKETGLMREHPGCFVLKQEHVDIVEKARTAWQKENPGTTPGWCVCHECRPLENKEKMVAHVETDFTLARLLWLEYWMKWAMKKCKKPGVYNA